MNGTIGKGTRFNRISALALISLLILSLCPLVGCAQKTDGGGWGGLTVVTTIFPAYDFARAVGGDFAHIEMLVRPGAEAHTFDPSPQDMLAIESADLFVCIGGESEAWADSLLASLSGDKPVVVRLIDTVAAVPEEIVPGMQAGEESGEIEYDEHIWTSPANAVLMVGAVRDALIAADGDNADAYRARAEAYMEEIRAVGRDIADVVASAKRDMLVFGDRFPFRYLADEYGLSYAAAFPGCSAESEAGAGTIAHLVNLVRQENIPIVYYIELSRHRVADVIAAETGARTALLHSCHNVTLDEFNAGETYVMLMRRNIDSLRAGLL